MEDYPFVHAHIMPRGFTLAGPPVNAGPDRWGPWLRTGRVLGAGDYDMRPGTDTRIRVRVGHLPKPTKVRLTMREDNGAIGWPEVTLRPVKTSR